MGECQEASGATQALQKVRDLIISLEDCPGAHDFPLSLPSGSDDHVINEEEVVTIGDDENAIPDVDNTENIENAIENIENNINEQVAEESGNNNNNNNNNDNNNNNNNDNGDNNDNNSNDNNDN